VKQPASLTNPLTKSIERCIISAGADGITHEQIMRKFQVGRTCVRNHIKVLEEEARAYRVRHKKHDNRLGPPTVFYTFHAGPGKTSSGKQPARRDWLVEAFFGPDRKEAA
jgi:ribosomal protein S14